MDLGGVLVGESDQSTLWEIHSKYLRVIVLILCLKHKHHVIKSDWCNGREREQRAHKSNGHAKKDLPCVISYAICGKFVPIYK